MKKYGGFIPGIRPGRPTAEYLQFVLSPDHPAGLALPGHHRVLPNLFFDLTRQRQQPELPVRRHRGADHGRRGAGDGEADREPAHAAQLRRVPALVRARPRRARPVRARAPRRSSSPRTSRSRRSPPATSSGPTSAQGTELGREAKKYMDAGDLVPDEVTIAWSGTGWPSRTPATGSCSTASRAPCRRPTRSTSSLADLGTALDVVLELVVDDDEVVRRLSGRRTCRSCGKIWHVDFDPPTARGHLRPLRRRAVPARRRQAGDRPAPARGLRASRPRRWSASTATAGHAGRHRRDRPGRGRHRARASTRCASYGG